MGIALRADAENNYGTKNKIANCESEFVPLGSATRVALYHKDISKLVGDNLPGIDNKPTPSSPPPPPPHEPVRDSKYPRLVSLPEKLTFEEAEEACLELRGTVAAPTEPHFEEHLKS